MRIKYNIKSIFIKNPGAVLCYIKNLNAENLT